MEELKKAAEEEIDERLDASVKRILQQNRRMAEELKIHVQVSFGAGQYDRSVSRTKEKCLCSAAWTGGDWWRQVATTWVGVWV